MRPCRVGLVEGMPVFGVAAAFSVAAVFFVYNSSKDNLYCFASGSLAGCKRAAPGRSRSDPHRTKARGGVVSASGRPQPMGRLTTHVLDSAHGCPGHGIKIELYRVEGQQLELIATTLTNHDGRCDQPVLQGEDFRPGVYQLVFNAGRLLSRPRRAIAGAGIPRPGGAAFRHRLRRRSLPCAAADLALQLFDLSRQLGACHETLTP